LLYPVNIGLALDFRNIANIAAVTSGIGPLARIFILALLSVIPVFTILLKVHYVTRK
jgi:hypothetical protein